MSLKLTRTQLSYESVILQSTPSVHFCQPDRRGILDQTPSQWLLEVFENASREPWARTGFPRRIIQLIPDHPEPCALCKAASSSESLRIPSVR
jgi:hypothetical protein